MLYSISQIPNYPFAYEIFIFLKNKIINLFKCGFLGRGCLFVCFLFVCFVCVRFFKKKEITYMITEFLCLNNLMNKNLFFFFKQIDGSSEWLSAELNVK